MCDQSVLLNVSANLKVMTWVQFNKQQPLQLCEHFRMRSSGDLHQSLLMSNPETYQYTCICCKNSMLHLAVISNNYLLVEFLLNKNVEVNVRNDNGETPLHLACDVGIIAIVWLLLKHGADPNSIDDGGFSPLYISLLKNNLSLAATLLFNGAIVNGFFSERFHQMKSHPQYLLYSCALVNMRDEKGLTPFYSAVLKNDAQQVIELLQNGADVNMKFKSETVLHVACRKAAKECVSILLNAKADIAAVDEDGKTALHHAAAGSDIDTVYLLLRHGGNVNTEDKQHHTPLEIAAIKSTAGVVTCLLDNGAKIRASTIMPLVIEFGTTSVAETFFERGVDVETKNSYGRTLLFIAVKSRREDMVRLLLTKQANVNIQGEMFSPVLSTAVCAKNIEIVKLLIACGADVSSADSQGRTPLFHAIRLGRHEIAAELYKTGCASIIEEISRHPSFQLLVESFLN